MSAFWVFKQCKVHSAWQLTSSCLIRTSALHRTVSSSLCVLHTAHCPSQSTCLQTMRICKGQSGYERVDICQSPIALAAFAAGMDMLIGLYISHHSTQIADVQTNTSKSALTCGSCTTVPQTRSNCRLCLVLKISTKGGCITLASQRCRKLQGQAKQSVTLSS